MNFDGCIFAVAKVGDTLFHLLCKCKLETKISKPCVLTTPQRTFRSPPQPPLTVMWGPPKKNGYPVFIARLRLASCAIDALAGVPLGNNDTKSCACNTYLNLWLLPTSCIGTLCSVVGISTLRLDNPGTSYSLCLCFLQIDTEIFFLAIIDLPKIR